MVMQPHAQRRTKLPKWTFLCARPKNVSRLARNEWSTNPKDGTSNRKIARVMSDSRTTSLHRLRHDCTAHSDHHGRFFFYMSCYRVRKALTYPCSHHSHWSSRAHRRLSRAAAPRWPCDHSQPRGEGACHEPAHRRAMRGKRASIQRWSQRGY